MEQKQMEMFGGMISPDAKIIQQSKKDQNLINLVKSVTVDELISYAEKIRNNEELTLVEFNRLTRISFCIGVELYNLNLSDVVDQHRKVLRNLILRTQSADFNKDKIRAFFEVLNEIPNYDFLKSYKDKSLAINDLHVPGKLNILGEEALKVDFITLVEKVKKILGLLTIPVNIANSIHLLLEKDSNQWTDSDFMVFNSVFYQESALDMKVVSDNKQLIVDLFSIKDLERILNIGYESVDQTNQTIMGTEMLMNGVEFLQTIQENSIDNVVNYIGDIAMSFVEIPNIEDGLSVQLRSKLIKGVESFMKKRPEVVETTEVVEHESNMIYSEVKSEIDFSNANPTKSNSILSIKNLLLEKNDFMRFKNEEEIVDFILDFDYYSSKEAQESAVLLTDFIKKTLTYAPESFEFTEEVAESFNFAVESRKFDLNKFITLLKEASEKLKKEHKIKIQSLILPIDASVKNNIFPLVEWLISRTTYLDFETKAYIVSVYFDGVENSAESYNQLIQIISLIENGYIKASDAHYYTELKTAVENTDIVIPGEEGEESTTVKLMSIFKNNANVEDDLQQLTIVNSFIRAFEKGAETLNS